MTRREVVKNKAELTSGMFLFLADPKHRQNCLCSETVSIHDDPQVEWRL